MGHHPENAAVASSGTPLSGWVIVAILAAIAVSVWLFVRWWKKLK